MLKITQLEKMVKKFLDESILLLQKYNVEGQFKPDDYEPILIKLKNGGRKWTVRKRKRYSYNLIRYKKEIQNLKSCKIIEEQIAAISNSIEAEKNTKGFILSQYIYNQSYPVEILWTALNKQCKTPQLSQHNFQEIIKGLKEILIEKQVSVITTSILSRDLVFRKLRKLDDNTTFKFLTLRELSNLYSEASLAINFTDVMSWLDNWAIVITDKVPINTFLNYSYDSTKKISELIFALRLSEDSFIVDRFVLSRLKYETGLLKNFEGYKYTRSLKDVYSGLNLPQKKLPQLKKIKKSVKLISDSDGLTNPLLRRFLNAPERRNIEDGLLDLIIVLEGMFVPEERGGSIGYKFALRATAICVEYRINIKNISEEIKNQSVEKYFHWFISLYSIRSELVHGSRKKGENKITKFIEKYQYSSIIDVFQSAYLVLKNVLNIYLINRWYNISDTGERAKNIDQIVLNMTKKK